MTFVRDLARAGVAGATRAICADAALADDLVQDVLISAQAVRDQPILSQLPRDACRSSLDRMSTGDAARGCMTRHPTYC
jgi:DNA-directed RNA polymerase specialized sigma24 family protein